MINISAIPGSHDAKYRTVRDLLRPLLAPEAADDHTHHYAIALVSPAAGEAYDLHAFEAPCPIENAAGNIRAVIAALREAADQVEAGHADLLEPAAEPEKLETEAHGVCDQHGAWSSIRHETCPLCYIETRATEV